MKKIPKWLWGLITVSNIIIIGFIDLITGYELNFFLFYFLPVSLAAWFIGLGASIGLSVLSAIVWLAADVFSGHTHSLHFYAVWNTLIRLSSFIFIGWVLSHIQQLLDHQRKLSEQLQASLSEVKILEAFIPICSQCKKIRDERGNWQQLEKYISEHSNTQFSHSYCPECAKKAMIEAGLLKE